MTAHLDHLGDEIRDLRARSLREGGVFWIAPGKLGVFEPAAAQKASALQFHDMTLPDRLVDLLRGKKSEPVSWKQVRAAWAPQMRRLTEGPSVEALAARMCASLDERLGRPLDVLRELQEVYARALVPVVIAGLSTPDTDRILKDHAMKVKRLLAPGAPSRTLPEAARVLWTQAAAGLAVRRELHGRAKGQRPRQLDLADPLVDMLPVLGMDRASYAVTTVLTAIAGPPGGVGACLLFELTHRPDWTARLTDELSRIPLPEFCRAPAALAPVTHRFVKETLRMWSAPAFLSRPARTDIDLGRARVKAGQEIHLSPFLLHRDPGHWRDPDTFDPDRWLEEADHSGWYVPFGWSPTACIGASLGMIQLQLLCHLACTRYRVSLPDDDRSHIAPSAVHLTRDFRATIARR